MEKPATAEKIRLTLQGTIYHGEYSTHANDGDP